MAIGAGVWAVMSGRGGEPTRLVPAWQLTSARTYDSNGLVDPIVSWSPDSKSLLFTGIGAQFYRNFLYQWHVGDKKVTRLIEGSCPNYVSNDTILYYKASPRSIVEHNLATRRERPIARELVKWDLWREFMGFGYDPVHKTLALRLAKLTRYYEPGCEEADLTGKRLGPVTRTTGGGILDRSSDPKGGREAVILGDLTGEARQLRIARPGEEFKAKTIVENSLGAVAWSPDGKTVAFAEADEVRLLDPSDHKIVTVARFSNSEQAGDGRYVCRLAWSPNSRYIAAVELIPYDESNTFMMIYVLKVGS